MPLLVPQLPIITNLRSLVGKKIVDEEKVTGDSDFPVEKIVYKSQLPKNVLVSKQDVDHVAITGAVKSGYTPIMVDADDIVIRIY